MISLLEIVLFGITHDRRNRNKEEKNAENRRSTAINNLNSKKYQQNKEQKYKPNLK